MKKFWKQFTMGVVAAMATTTVLAKEPQSKVVHAKGRVATRETVRVASSDLDVGRAMRAAGVKPMSTASDKSAEALVAPTQEHFAALQKIVRDLRRNSTGGQTMTAGLKALWMRKQAAKIDELSGLGVDPELVKVSEKISASLYESADNITGTMGRSRVKQSAVPAHFDYYRYDELYAIGPAYGGYAANGEYGYAGGLAPYGTSTVIAVPNNYTRTRQQNMIGQEDRIAAFNEARVALENAEKDVASVRRQLANQYGVKF